MGACKTYGSIGNVHEKMGQHDSALECLNKHLELAEKLDDLSEQCLAMGRLGVTCRSLGRHDEARDWFEGQLAIALRLNDEALRIQAYGHLSVLYRSPLTDFSRCSCPCLVSNPGLHKSVCFNVQEARGP